MQIPTQVGMTLEENLSITTIYCDSIIATHGKKIQNGHFDCQLGIFGWQITKTLRTQTKMIHLCIFFAMNLNDQVATEWLQWTRFSSGDEWRLNEKYKRTLGQ